MGLCNCGSCVINREKDLDEINEVEILQALHRRGWVFNGAPEIDFLETKAALEGKLRIAGAELAQSESDRVRLARSNNELKAEIDRLKKVNHELNNTIASMGNDLIKLKNHYQELQSSKIADCMAKSIAGENTTINTLYERNHNLVVENDKLKIELKEVRDTLAVVSDNHDEMGNDLAEAKANLHDAVQRNVELVKANRRYKDQAFYVARGTAPNVFPQAYRLVVREDGSAFLAKER